MGWTSCLDTGVCRGDVMADSGTGTMPSEDMPRLGPTWSRGGGMFKPPKRPEGHPDGVRLGFQWLSRLIDVRVDVDVDVEVDASVDVDEQGAHPRPFIPFRAKSPVHLFLGGRSFSLALLPTWQLGTLWVMLSRLFLLSLPPRVAT